MYRMARRRPPTARSWLRSPSTAVALRSASPRTVSAREMAMVARAALSHKTARRALPRAEFVRRGRCTDAGSCLLLGISLIRQAVDGDGCTDCHRAQAGGVVFQRRHVHTQAYRPALKDPIRAPVIDVRELARLQVRKVAPGQLVGEHERLSGSLNRPEL